MTPVRGAGRLQVLFNCYFDEKGVSKWLALLIKRLPGAAVRARFGGGLEQNSDDSARAGTGRVQGLFGLRAQIWPCSEPDPIISAPVAIAAVLNLPALVERRARRNDCAVWNS